MHKKFYYSFLFTLFTITNLYANVYYVSVVGLPGNPGTLALPWSIAHAFTTAQPGDTVWIKAGNYGAVNINITNSNTAFIGYTIVPGDITNNSQPDSLNIFLQNNYDAIYPTLDGGNRATAGTAINFVSSNRKNIILKNIQIRNYQLGISIIGSYNLIENIIAYNFGDVNVFYSGTGISTYGNKNIIRKAFVLNGAAEGINIKGDSNLVTSSKVYSNDTTTQYSDTDYYIYITANSGTKQGKYNVIEDCYLERISKYLPHLGHSGHGLCLTISYNHKPCDFGGGFCYDSTQKVFVVENNIIRNCTTKNIGESVMLRGDKVRNNYIEGVTSLSFGSLVILNSSRYNTFNRCNIKNSYYWKDPNTSTIYRKAGIELLASNFGDSTAQNISDPETNSYPWEVTLAASYNTFTNCIFENVPVAITFHNYSEFYYPSYHILSGQAIDRINRKKIVGNNFFNCTFIAMETDSQIMQPVNRPSFLLAMRGTANNSFTNCIIHGFYNFEGRAFALNTQPLTVERHGIIPSGNTYYNCLFYKNAFDSQIPYNGLLTPVGNPPLVPGVNNTVGGYFDKCLINNPLFVDINNKNFHLSTSSPCIDYGITIPVNDDFDGNTRPCGDWHDIGAYEFQNCNTYIKNAENADITIQIFPNPTSENIEIRSVIALKQIKVYNSLGVLVKEVIIPSQFSHVLKTEEFETGFYICNIQLADESFISRKIVKR